MSVAAWVLHSAYNATAGNVRRLAEEVLFESTRKTIAVALSAKTLAEGVEVMRTAAWSGNNEFWLDMMILSSAVLVTFAITVCSLRCCSWFCLGLPRAAREVREIQSGTKPYQVAAVKERAERRARIESGLEEKPVTVAEDLARLSKMMAAAQARRGKPKRSTTSTTTPSSSSSNNNNNSGAECKRTTVASEASSAAAQAASETFTATRRAAPPATCAAVLRGFPEVNLLLASPAQKYLLVGCRSKRKTMLYSQSDTRLGQGKMGDVAAAPVEETVRQAMRHETRVEVYSAAFTTDDARLIVGERASDTFFVLSVQAPSNAQAAPTLTSCLRQFTLQRRRLVSSLPSWGVIGSNALICFYDKDCEVEVIDYGDASATAAVTSSRHRFKVGNALAWAQRDAQVFAAGSFLREPRWAQLTQRSSGGTATGATNAGGNSSSKSSGNSNKGGEYVLETNYIFPNPQKLRVLAMALVTRGTPAFNTRNYLIVFLEDGNGAVYDLDTISTSNTVGAVCTFTDTDYAGYRPGEPPMRLIVALSGQAYQERITLGLVRGAGVTVLRQRPHRDGATWQFDRVADLRDVQEGDEVKDAVLLQQGRLLATCGVADGRHVRFFAVPSTDG